MAQQGFPRGLPTHATALASGPLAPAQPAQDRFHPRSRASLKQAGAFLARF